MRGRGDREGQKTTIKNKINDDGCALMAVLLELQLDH